MKKLYPQKEANNITVVLREAGVAAFPVDVKSIATEISEVKYPDSPITIIKGDAIPDFEGALVSAPPGKKGWGIFYNNAMKSQGRINFTLGHEFGHYILHREAYPDGFKCSTEDMATWKSDYAVCENEANIFAATLLMPFDDFRVQIEDRARPDFGELGACSDRYDVSLIAATLRWLQYTLRSSMLVVSRDGFILWARSSNAAMKSRLYFKTRNRPPIELPTKSLAVDTSVTNGAIYYRESDGDAWFNLPCTEHVILSEQYDFTLSLLHFPDDAKHKPDHEKYHDRQRL